MKTVIIGTTYDGTAANVTDLTATEIGIFAGISSKHFVIASGRDKKISPSISKTPRELIVKRTAPVTAQKHAISVEFSHFGANTYDEFIIRTNIDFYGGFESRNSNAKVYSFTGIFANAAAVATRAASEINSYSAGEVQATVSGNTVVITPKDKNANAIINVAGDFIPFTGTPTQTITVTQVTAQRNSSGYRDDLRALDASAQYPTDRTRTENKFAALFDESATATYPYDVYYIGYLNPEHIDGNGIGKSFSPLNELYVAIPNAGATDFETALVAQLGVNVENGVLA